MKKILILLLGLLLLPWQYAHADFRENECVLIKADDIIKGRCKTNSTFGNKLINLDIIFKNKKYNATFYECLDKPKPSCQKRFLSLVTEPFEGSEAKEQYRDDELHITKSPTAKFKCLKRIKASKNSYELCFVD